MATNLSALEAAMAEATASHPPVDRKLHTTQAEYAEARAALEARARAGQTVQARDARGHFTRGVKMFSVGPAPIAPARKVAKIEAPRPAWTPTEADIEAALAARQMGVA